VGVERPWSNQTGQVNNPPNQILRKRANILISTPSTPPISAQAAREVRRDTALRRARTCYDHLAGVAGVALFDELLNRGWLEQTECQDSPRVSYRLTPLGQQALAGKGVDLTPSSSKRRFAYGCTDWTERRLHVGGALGAAVLRALQARDIVRRTAGTRIVAVQSGIAGWFNSST
jgi:hypothetical protein